MQTLKKLVFFGNERLSSGFDASGAPLLTSLLDAGYDIVALVANYEPARSRKSRKLEVAEVAEAHNIPVLLPRHPGDVTDQLRALQATAGILAAYGKIVPQEILDIFPRGIINIHPSLLPKYRGPTPIEQMLLDGATETGVSIMQLAKKMDAGPVYAQATVALDGQETKADLTKLLTKLGIRLLQKYLKEILAGSLTPKPQDETKASYCQLIRKEDGLVNWQKPALQLEREVRAYLGWPGSRTQLFSQDLIVLEAHTGNNNLAVGEVKTTPEAIIVGCGEQSLAITKLRPSGRSSMSAADFLRGLRTT